MTSGASTEVRAPISPELVLVAPPDVARVARDRLPDPLAAQRRLHAAQALATSGGGGAAVAVPAPRARRRGWTWWLAAAVAVGLAVLAAAVFFQGSAFNRGSASKWRTLSGRGNNVDHPSWGAENRPYLRVAPVSYTNGLGRMDAGPPARYISNRIFNDVGQNLFSESAVSQWGWVWGQFLDHTFGLREREARRERRRSRSTPPIRSRGSRTTLGEDRLHPDARRARHGRDDAATADQHGSELHRRVAVYGGTDSRLEWLREGPVDGKMSNNRATLLLPDGYLPRVTARDRGLSAGRKRAVPAPTMDLMGPLVGNRSQAVVAGDVRANENIALTATHTLFAREHNRIVSLLPASLPEEDRFQIARRVVGAEQQYITYREFLPALGVHLSPYRGYDRNVDADDLERVRDGRVPRAQHGPRRVRARGAGRHLHAKQARSVRDDRASKWSGHEATSRS